MKMSEEMAVRLHRMMWWDMQKELGNNPSGKERLKFKREWIKRNFPGESIANDCWLCEYASSVANCGGGDPYCKHCPISWPDCHCNTLDFSYAKEPINDILALPARNECIAKKAENIHDLSRDIVVGEVAKASGLPVECDIWSHIKKIQEKAVAEKAESIIDDFLYRCEKYPDTPIDEQLKKRLRAIKEKAVEDYFAKTPGAKLATMDVDQAFKQYAKEQKAPIFRALAEESGLDPTATVKAHINAIYSKGFDDGKDEEFERIMDKIQEMLEK